MKSSLPLTEQDLTDFAKALEETSKDFDALRQRYGEVREAFFQRTQVQTQLTQTHLPQAELHRLQTQLETLEVTLENQLFIAWATFRTTFWQLLRFVGLGLVVGWFGRGWFGS